MSAKDSSNNKLPSTFLFAMMLGAVSHAYPVVLPNWLGSPVDPWGQALPNTGPKIGIFLVCNFRCPAPLPVQIRLVLSPRLGLYGFGFWYWFGFDFDLGLAWV